MFVMLTGAGMGEDAPGPAELVAGIILPKEKLVRSKYS